MPRRRYLSAALTALSVGVALSANNPAAWAQKTIGGGGPAPITTNPPIRVGAPIKREPVTSLPEYTSGEIQAGENMDASPQVARELALILQDDTARTDAQKKYSTNIRYASRLAQGQQAVAGVSALTSTVEVLPDNTVNCDVTVPSTNTAALEQAIKTAGGTVVGVSTWSKKIRAFLPLSKVETLAGRSDVTFIEPAVIPRLLNSRQHPLKNKEFVGVPYRPSTNSTDRKPRTAADKLAASLAALPSAPLTLPLFPSLIQAQTAFGPKFDKEGYYGHQIDVASVSPYNMTGAGVKIAVLSDGVKNLAKVQADGYLGPVTVVADAPGNSGEGTAMLQIVHDMAPDAQLFFATGFTGKFSDYIVALRDTYGCDIILDDLGFSNDLAFSEGDIIQAINHVTSEGALYFSSAGNEGNVQHYDVRNGKKVLHSDADTWEGDFSPGGTMVDTAANKTVQVHVFSNDAGTAKYETAIHGTTNGGSTNVQWSDAFIAQPGYSMRSNYIIFTTFMMTDPTTGLPVEKIRSSGINDSGNPSNGAATMNGDHIFVGLVGGVTCALHVERAQDGELGDNDTLTFVTAGQSTGHNAGRSSFGVGATDASRTTSAFTSDNDSINFSSDGPRRLFWTVDSAGNQIPVVKGVQTFAENGYITLLKPDITAANGVTTDTPGFAPFYGTSAASPHAGAIAGLVLSYGTAASPKVIMVTTGTGTSATTYGATTIIGRNLAPADMKTVLESSAIDNNVGLNLTKTSAYDVDGGFGIVMPVLAAQYLQKFFDSTTVGTAVVNASTYKVTWNTNLPASSVIHYGTSPTALNLIARGSGTPGTTHTVSVPNVSTTVPVYFTIETATPTGSVSFVGTAPTQLNSATVTVPTQKSNVVLSNLAIIRLASGQIQATVNLSNTGPGISGAVSLNAALGGVTGTPAPASLGTIAAGKTAKAVFVFPTVAKGTQTQFVLTGTEGSNTISSTTQVQVP